MNKTLSIYVRQDGIWKRRIYVENPSDAPDWAQVEEGPQGGWYYETQGTSEGQSQFGAPELSEPPRHMNPAYAVETEEVRGGGRYKKSMSIGVFDDGSEVYIKEAAENHNAAIDMSDTIINSLGGNAPQTFYDKENERVLIDGVNGETFDRASDWSLKNSDINRDIIDKDSFVDTVASAVITGNWDIGYNNMMIDYDGNTWLVDNDEVGGKDLSVTQEVARLMTRDAQEMAEGVDMSIRREDIQEEAEEKVNNITDDEGNIVGGFKETLQSASSQQGEIGQEIGETIKSNIKAIHDKEVLW